MVILTVDALQKKYLDFTIVYTIPCFTLPVLQTLLVVQGILLQGGALHQGILLQGDSLHKEPLLQGEVLHQGPLLQGESPHRAPTEPLLVARPPCTPPTS